MANPTLLMQATAASQPNGVAAFLFQTFPFIAVFFVFYLLWIRPQQRRVKEHQATIAAVKKGDAVITAGGIFGKVIKVSDDEAEIEIANGVRVRVVKSTLTNVLTGTTKPAND